MKAIKHSHHEQYLRLSNDDAALLVSSGRWVYTSKFEARQAAYRPRRHLALRIAMFVTTIAAVIVLLVLSTAAHASALPCLTKSEAIATGKHARYRQVTPDTRCWYVTKRTPAKSEFTVHPRPAIATVGPARLTPQEAPREQGQSSLKLGAGTVHRTEFTATVDADAFLSLTGLPERFFEYDEYWNLMTGWVR